MRYVAVAVLVLLAFLPSINVPGLPVDNKPNDTLVWKALLNGMADYIEADGRVSKPLIATMSDVQQYRDAVLKAPIRSIGGGDAVAAKISPKLSAITEFDLSANDARGRVVKALRDAAGEL